jgi:hypothetical protein
VSTESDPSLFSPPYPHPPRDDHIQVCTTMTVYKVRASLRRRPKVPVTVDTDIKCIAECVKEAA